MIEFVKLSGVLSIEEVFSGLIYEGKFILEEKNYYFFLLYCKILDMWVFEIIVYGCCYDF